MSWISDLQIIVLNKLNTLAMPATVIGEWVIEVQRDKVTGTELHLAPASRSSGPASRGYTTRRATFALMVIVPLEQGAEDDAAEAAQAVGDKLDTLTQVGDYIVRNVSQPAILDANEWRENRMLSTTYLIEMEATGAY